MGSAGGETERVRRIWERTAAGYDAAIAFTERLLFSGGREWICARAEGRVLEIALGTGRNLPFYPAGARLTGIDISRSMLEIARDRAAQLGLGTDLLVSDAQELEFEDGSFDTVVITLALCSIPDEAKALAEAHRVLRPGGRLLLLEHVRSSLWPVRAIQHLLDPLAVRFQGDHLVREPLEHLSATGFLVERIERTRLGLVEKVVARRP